MKYLPLVVLVVVAVAVSCTQSPSRQLDKAVSWASSILKEKGIEIPFHPATDFIELKRQYEANPELWNASLDFLSERIPTLHEMNEFGTFPIVGEKCYTTLSEYIPKPVEKTKLEGHRKFIDIQVTEGPVNWGIYPSDGPDLTVLSDYNPDKDNGFYNSTEAAVYRQEADSPCIFVFFPKDLHNPSYAVEGVDYPNPLKKIVIKVANAL